VTDKDSLTRADLVRQRRKEQEIHRSRRPAQRASVQEASMPRRGATLDASTVRAKPGSRYVQYEAVAAPSIAGQMEAPALPRFHVGWRVLSFFLVALFAAGLYFVWTMPTFRVTGTTLAGNQMLSAEEIESVLHLNGAPVFLIVPADAEYALRMNFPEIISAKVSVELPNKVTATITERVPVIRWEQDGAYAWVDEEGVVFRPRGDVQGLIVVSASGSPTAGIKPGDDPLAPVPFVAEEIIESIRLLGPQIPQGSDLLYNPQYGLGWVDRRGWTVWFGTDPQEVDVKMRVYSVLVDSLAQRGITPSFISVAYPGAPYYRLGQ
jgi:hypothetical protein